MTRSRRAVLVPCLIILSLALYLLTISAVASAQNLPGEGRYILNAQVDGLLSQPVFLLIESDMEIASASKGRVGMQDTLNVTCNLQTSDTPRIGIETNIDLISHELVAQSLSVSGIRLDLMSPDAMIRTFGTAYLNLTINTRIAVKDDGREVGVKHYRRSTVIRSQWPEERLPDSPRLVEAGLNVTILSKAGLAGGTQTIEQSNHGSNLQQPAAVRVEHSKQIDNTLLLMLLLMISVTVTVAIRRMT